MEYKKPQIKRLQLAATPEIEKKIEELRVRSRSTISDVLRDGVSFLYEYTRKIDEGYVLAYRKRDDPSQWVEVEFFKYT